MRVLVPLVLVAALGFHPTANAFHGCEPAHLVVDVAGVAYVTYDRFYHVGDFDNWVYLESNGRPGLQRGGADLFGGRDACQEPDPDTAVVWFAFCCG